MSAPGPLIASQPDLAPFLSELNRFRVPQLTMGKVILAYHMAHPEDVMAPDLRAKLRQALLAMIEEGLIAIAADAWDDHATEALPRSILLLSRAIND